MAIGIKRQHELLRIIGDPLSGEMPRSKGARLKPAHHCQDVANEDLDEFEFVAAPINEVLLHVPKAVAQVAN